jgi:dolichol-phosphate mannosyltransferase
VSGTLNFAWIYSDGIHAIDKTIFASTGRESIHHSKYRFVSIKLSVLMPVFNERATFEEILVRVQAVAIEKEIIVVDNCSTDGTREILQSLLDSRQAGDANSSSLLRIVLQTENGGKGNSVRRALELARGEYVIVQDADLEYDPNDYLKLMQAVENAEVVFGTRLLPGSETRRKQPRTAFYYGRVGLSVLLRLLYAVPISDVATCYKLIKRDVAQNLDLKSSGFDLDFEIGAKIAKLKKQHAIRYVEVPVSYHPRTELEGKKIRAWHDGWRAAWALLRFRFAK